MSTHEHEADSSEDRTDQPRDTLDGLNRNLYETTGVDLKSRRHVLKGALGTLATGAMLGATADRAAGQESQVIDFGPTVVGSCSENVFASVTNENEAPLQSSIEGPDADEFAILSGSTIPPGATRDIVILFVPTSPGPKQATVVGTAGGTSAGSDTLVGVGVTLANATPPDGFVFPDQEVGVRTRVPITATFPAVFPEAIEILGAQKAGETPDEFEITPGQVGQTVQPGGTFEFTVDFVPTSPGQKSANLVVEAQFVDSGFPFCSLFGVQGLAVDGVEDRIAQVFDLNEEATQLAFQALQVFDSGGSFAEIRELAVQARPLYEQMLAILEDLTGDDSNLSEGEQFVLLDLIPLVEEMLEIADTLIDFIDRVSPSTAGLSAGLLPTLSLLGVANRFFRLPGAPAEQVDDPRAEVARLLEELLARGEDVEDALLPLVDESVPSSPLEVTVDCDVQDPALVRITNVGDEDVEARDIDDAGMDLFTGRPVLEPGETLRLTGVWDGRFVVRAFDPDTDTPVGPEIERIVSCPNRSPLDVSVSCDVEDPAHVRITNRGADPVEARDIDDAGMDIITGRPVVDPGETLTLSGVGNGRFVVQAFDPGADTPVGRLVERSVDCGSGAGRG